MTDLRAKLLVVGTRINNELGAARCIPFAVTEVGPARVDIDAIHAAALILNEWSPTSSIGGPEYRAAYAARWHDLEARLVAEIGS